MESKHNDGKTTAASIGLPRLLTILGGAIGIVATLATIVGGFYGIMTAYQGFVKEMKDKDVQIEVERRAQAVTQAEKEATLSREKLEQHAADARKASDESLAAQALKQKAQLEIDLEKLKQNQAFKLKQLDIADAASQRQEDALAKDREAKNLESKEVQDLIKALLSEVGGSTERVLATLSPYATPDSRYRSQISAAILAKLARPASAAEITLGVKLLKDTGEVGMESLIGANRTAYRQVLEMAQMKAAACDEALDRGFGRNACSACKVISLGLDRALEGAMFSSGRLGMIDTTKTPPSPTVPLSLPSDCNLGIQHDMVMSADVAKQTAMALSLMLNAEHPPSWSRVIDLSDTYLGDTILGRAFSSYELIVDRTYIGGLDARHAGPAATEMSQLLRGTVCPESRRFQFADRCVSLGRVVAENYLNRSTLTIFEVRLSPDDEGRLKKIVSTGDFDDGPTVMVK